MVLRHPGETAICIDHWAALVVEGDSFRVLQLDAIDGTGYDGKGSVGADGSFLADRSGEPGIWRKTVVDGVVQTSLVAASGKLADLVQPASSIVEDSQVSAVRKANPL